MASVQNGILLSLCSLVLTLFAVNSYPHFYMVRPQQQHIQNALPSDALSLSPPKRAFDRLDVSPFDFDSISKRFNDDNELSAIPLDSFFLSSSPYFFEGFPKRSFGRSDNSAIFGQMKTRAFDRPMEGSI